MVSGKSVTRESYRMQISNSDCYFPYKTQRSGYLRVWDRVVLDLIGRLRLL